jgi:hypothetical protein
VPAPSTFDYAIVRVVPRVERAEFINAGVIVYCAVQQFLEAQVELDRRRLAALAPGLNLGQVEECLRSIPLICAGGPQAGPVGQSPQAARFHWLVAPRSTIVQTSPVHCGLCTDPGAALEALLDKMVRPQG